MAGVVGELKELGDMEGFRGLVVLHFWADWSEPCKVLQEVVVDLAKEYTKVKFYKVIAEDLPELSLKYEVVAVPTFILLKGGQVVGRVNGAHVPDLVKKIATHAQTLAISSPTTSVPKEDLDTRLKRLVGSAPCMLFMKGTPTEPKCGFSRKIVSILQEFDTDFSTFNILMDEEVRQGLKKFSNWPSYPQLYVNGELIGGLDIIKEMKENGELDSLLSRKSLDGRLTSLISQHNVMVFMKGTKEEPGCGFSKTLCSILVECKVEFETFDILSDKEVFEGLKKFSNCPTYPQLYVKGELVGGLDIVKELQEANELMEVLSS